ncbi:MAG: hypothetical protein KC417_06430 [Myxococcales bacterium]|nr:hypothetical protein [Myxococcales bacterium]
MTSFSSTKHSVFTPLFFAFAAAALLVGCGDSSSSGTAPDAATDAAVDGANDDAATIDASTEDAATADADSGPQPKPYSLFAHFDGSLYSVNATTGALTEIGATGQTYIVLEWDDEAGVMRVIADPYSDNGGPATPKLGTIDLCSGTVTKGTALVEDTTDVRRAEGLAKDPESGTWWITYGTVGNTTPTQYISNRIGTVNIETGAVTYKAAVDTLQDDGDILEFEGSTLFALDIATVNNQGNLYEVNQTTGAQTVGASTGPSVLRIAYHPVEQVMYAATGTPSYQNRGIGTLNTTTGVVTPIGSYISNAEHPSQQFTSLAFARAPDCN